MSEDVYFMPCLLQVVAWEVVEEHRVSGGKALALHFPDSGPLMGTFCSTVAYLLSPENSHPCPWRVVQNEAGAPECLHRNVIEFTVSDYAGAVSLVDHFTHFELHIHTAEDHEAELWKLAHDAVFAGLKKAGKTIGYTNNTPVPAIVCPAHPHPAKPHPATVKKGWWTCSISSKNFGKLPRSQFRGCLSALVTLLSQPRPLSPLHLLQFPPPPSLPSLSPQLLPTLPLPTLLCQSVPLSPPLLPLFPLSPCPLLLSPLPLPTLPPTLLVSPLE
ncbi:hypothetical protein GBAR_LOCUS20665, partial [Geodia barretti]